MRMNIYNASFTSQYDVMPSIELEARIEAETRDDYIKLSKMLNTRSFVDMADALGKILCNCVQHGNSLPPIKNVYFNPPATIVLWDDGTKTVVKCQDSDTYSRETGLALCMAKKAMGNNSKFNDIFRKWIPEEKVDLSYRGDCASCKYRDLSEDEYPCHNCMLTNWEPAK